MLEKSEGQGRAVALNPDRTLQTLPGTPPALKGYIGIIRIFTAAMHFPDALHVVQEAFLARRRSHQTCFEPFIPIKHMLNSYCVIPVLLGGVLGVCSKDCKSDFQVNF